MHWFTTWSREFAKELRGDRIGDAIDIYDHIDRAKKGYLYIHQSGID